MNKSDISFNEIDIKQFKKGKMISKDGFGIVYQVEDKKTGLFYAAKIIDCGNDQEQCDKMIKSEIKIMSLVAHPTIEKFIGFSKIDFQGENNITIIMELAKNGSLYDVLKKIQQFDCPKDYSNTTRQIILAGVARGMKYLHDQNIIHQNLKSGNILLDEHFYPHITDIGISKKIESGHSHSQSQYGGTLIYEAPEIFEKIPYDKKVDVYSFAILMYEVLTDSTPYPELENGKLSDHEFIQKVIHEHYRPKFKFPIKKSLGQLIEKCWSKNPEERPTFDEIYEKLSNQIKLKDDNDEENDFLLENVDLNEFNRYLADIEKQVKKRKKLPNDKKIKIIVIGEMGVGKQSIIRRYVKNLFLSENKCTIGFDISEKKFEYGDDHLSYDIQFFDIAGQERYGNNVHEIYKGASAAIIVFDLCRMGSFQFAEWWKNDVDKCTFTKDLKPIPTLLLGNKVDVFPSGSDRSISTDEIKKFVDEKKFINFFETSAKSGFNIIESVEFLIKYIIDNNIEPQYENIEPKFEYKDSTCYII